MLIEIEEEQIVPHIMLTDIHQVIDNIDQLRSEDLEYLEEYKWQDLQYDLNLLQALKTVYRYYTIVPKWDELENYIPELDHDLTETETGLGD